MRLTDHVTWNFNIIMFTAAIFLDIQKAFDTTWHPGLLHKISELHISSSLIKLVSSFLSNRKFRAIQAGVLQGSVLSTTLYSLYINDTPQTPRVYRALFADDTCIYTTDRKDSYVLRKYQRDRVVVWTLEHKDQWG